MGEPKGTYALDPTTNVRRFVREGDTIPPGWQPEDEPAEKAEKAPAKHATTRKKS
jgi:hypothetical protein